MAKTFVGIAATALALLVAQSVFDSAEARRGGGGGVWMGGGGRAFSGSAFSGRAFSAPSLSRRAFSAPTFSGRVYSGPSVRSYRFADRPSIGPRFYGRSFKSHRFDDKPFRRRFAHRGTRFLYAAPLAYGAYYSSYGDCYWLRRRALATGSAYWWDRYYACLNGYDYY